MSSTQISFSAHAATQAESASFAASPESVQRGCLFPQPRFSPPTAFFTGSDYPNGFRPGFLGTLDHGGLDACEYVASGGVDSLTIGNRCVAFQMAFRG